MKSRNDNMHVLHQAESLRVTPMVSRLRKLIFLLAVLTLSSLLSGILVDHAQAQTELGFKQEALNLRLKPPGFATDKQCNRKSGELRTLNAGVSNPDVKTAGATVFLSNSGDTPLTDLRFSAKVYSKEVGSSALFYPGFYRFYDPDTKPVDVWVCSTDSTIAPDDTQAFDLWIESEPSYELADLETWVFSGYLQVSADQAGVNPATMKFSLIDTAPAHKNLFNWILAIALVLTLILGAVVYNRRYSVPLSERMRTKISVNLDLKDSWASKIATVGGILGTILAASVLPEATFLMAKEQFVALNVLFGLLVVFAVVVHNVRQRVWSYLLASVVTIGAACGQIVTAILLFEEIGIQGTMTPFGVRLLQTLFILAAGIVFVVASRGMDPPVQEPPAGTRIAVDGTLGGTLARSAADAAYSPNRPRTTAAL